MLALDNVEETTEETTEEKTISQVERRRVQKRSFYDTPVVGKNLEPAPISETKIKRDMAARAAAWHDMTPTEKAFMLDDEKKLFGTWLQRRKEELDAMTMAGMLDRPEDEIDAHRRKTEGAVDEFPSGTVVAKPTPGNGRDNMTWITLYDAMAPVDDWLTAKAILAMVEFKHIDKVYTALAGLDRQGILVKGPTVVVESGRRMKQFAIARE